MLKAILDGIANVLDWIYERLPSWSIDTSKLSTSLQEMEQYLQLADKVFPVSEIVTILGILIAWAVVMLIFWAMMRAINLIRGAG